MDAPIEDRKARLAAIRKNRQNKGVNIPNVPTQGSEVSSRDSLVTDGSLDEHTNEDVKRKDSSVSESLQLDAASVASQPDILSPEPTIDTTPILETAPKLLLSELSNETIETVSLKVQNEILNNAQRASRDTKFTVTGHNKPKSYTKDLEDDLQGYFSRARFDTDKAINLILQVKYEASNR
jgi:hypothetical protein